MFFFLPTNLLTEAASEEYEAASVLGFLLAWAPGWREAVNVGANGAKPPLEVRPARLPEGGRGTRPSLGLRGPEWHRCRPRHPA